MNGQIYAGEPASIKNHQLSRQLFYFYIATLTLSSKEIGRFIVKGDSAILPLEVRLSQRKTP
jgi:hypothetical protein